MDILNVTNISKTFGKHKVLDNINFSIKEGDIVGFVGPNGAGKTTTIKILTNLIYPDKGSVTICGYDLLKQREKALANISAIVESPSLYTCLSGKDNIDFVRKIRGISEYKMNEIIDFIGLSHRINDTVKKYSLGMKQRLALGICLLSDPKLLILDEPTNGLDPSGTIDLRNLIIKLSKENKMSMFISSHMLTELEKVCDKIIFMKEGQIISTKNNGKNTSSQLYKIYITKSDEANQILKNCEYIYSYSFKNSEFLINIKNDKLNEILKMFIANSIDFSNIELVETDLEVDYSSMYDIGGKNDNTSIV